MMRLFAQILVVSTMIAQGAVMATLPVPPIPEQCMTSNLLSPTASVKHVLKANASTVHWGYTWNQNKPKLVVNSGDTVTVEMVSHHAGDYFDGMIKGDPGIEDIYQWGSEQRINTRGASGSGDGVHVLTGPIYVCGAERGDVLQIDILDLYGRKNPATGKTFGINAAAWWGYQFRSGWKDNKPREVTTIYEIITDKKGKAMYAVPNFQFTYGSTPEYSGPTTSCVPPNGTIPDAYATSAWSNSGYSYSPGVTTPCVNGTQHWTGYQYPGLITQHPTGTENYGIHGKFKVPINFHIGNIGLAPDSDVPVSSIPPMGTGGNMDNRRLGIGATLYLPVANPGALLTMGDAHTAQGDSEFDGTGIETHITGKFKLTLHKAASAPKLVANLSFPLIENSENWIVQGLSYNDNYLTAPDLQPDAKNSVFDTTGGATLDKAMLGAYVKARDWLMSAKDLTEDEAISFLTVMCDFPVIPKYAFDKSTKPYKPKVACGTSSPIRCKA